MDDFQGRADPSINNSLGWNTRADPPEIGGGRWTPPPPGQGLREKLKACVGVPGSTVPKSDDDPEQIDAALLIGDPALGKRNAWVFEWLEGREAPADRINAICALIWMGYGAWVNYNQDEANGYWTEARKRSAGEGFGDLRELAQTLATILRSLPA